MVKLEKSKQNKLKNLSKAIYILAKIAKVFTIIGIIFMIIGVAIAVACLNMVEVKDNGKIEAQIGESVLKYVDDGDKVSLKMDSENVEFTDAETINALRLVTGYLTKASKGGLILYLIANTAFTIANMVVAFIILNYVDKLFKNIANENTPFIEENVNIVRKIALFITISVGVSITGNGVIGAISNLGGKIETGYNLLTILIAFAISYIFEYAYNMQLDSETKIYGDEE